jgi:mono/diheme cytochrome c family protein
MQYGKFSNLMIASLFALGAAVPSAIAADGESPREIYDRAGCWGCHGYEGQGGRHGPAIARTPHNYEAFSAFVRTTAGRMPPFTERVVSDEDLQAIHAYLQSRPEPPPPSDFSLLQGVFPE